jgi:hypothetical protein
LTGAAEKGCFTGRSGNRRCRSCCGGNVALVVDTWLMAVSISAVVVDLGTTVNSVQSAIARFRG